jgi:hypothetical protein
MMNPEKHKAAEDQFVRLRNNLGVLEGHVAAGNMDDKELDSLIEALTGANKDLDPNQKAKATPEKATPEKETHERETHERERSPATPKRP